MAELEKEAQLYAISEYFDDEYEIHACKIIKETPGQWVVELKNEITGDPVELTVKKSLKHTWHYKFVVGYIEALQLRKEMLETKIDWNENLVENKRKETKRARDLLILTNAALLKETH